MTKLHRVISELQAVMKYQPMLSPNLAWRLHPDDLFEVMEAAKVYAEKMEHPWRPAGNFYLLGVRIFGDEAAPRLPETVSGEQK